MDIRRVLRHAVATTEIATVDYRDSQIPKWSCQAILYWSSTLAIHDVNARLLLLPPSGVFHIGIRPQVEPPVECDT